MVSSFSEKLLSSLLVGRAMRMALVHCSGSCNIVHASHVAVTSPNTKPSLSDDT